MDRVPAWGGDLGTRRTLYKMGVSISCTDVMWPLSNYFGCSFSFCYSALQLFVRFALKICICVDEILTQNRKVRRQATAVNELDS